MKLQLISLGALFLVFGIAGCGAIAHNYGSIHQSANQVVSNVSQQQVSSNETTKTSIVMLGIYASIQNVQVGTKNTMVTVEVNSVKKVYGKVGNVSIEKGSIIIISYRGSSKDYFMGNESPTKYLPVWPGLTIATIIHSRNNGITWNSTFDSYEYQKYGAYWNWKGQNFGVSVFR